MKLFLVISDEDCLASSIASRLRLIVVVIVGFSIMEENKDNKDEMIRAVFQRSPPFEAVALRSTTKPLESKEGVFGN